MDIKNMPAGKEMDRLIAVKVMGYELMAPPGLPPLQKPTDHGVEVLFSVPHYSTTWEGMRLVMEHMAHEPYAWTLESINTADGTTRWGAHYWNGGEADFYDHDHSAPLAVCRVALMVMEAK